jgi:hypothetical protein
MVFKKRRTLQETKPLLHRVEWQENKPKHIIFKREGREVEVAIVPEVSKEYARNHEPGSLHAVLNEDGKSVILHEVYAIRATDETSRRIKIHGQYMFPKNTESEK